MSRVNFVLLLVAVAFGLTGCQPPEGPRYPDITFDHLPPIELDVAEIIVRTPYQEPLDPPHVGEQFPVSPSRAALRWAHDRLRAVGTNGQAVVTINESSAVERELERTEGLKGVFTKDQAQSYEVTIDMKIEAQAGAAQRAASAQMRATKKTSVAEDADMNEREDTWYKLTQDVMYTFNDAMERQMRQTMGTFVR